jgi:hypothetical protein
MTSMDLFGRSVDRTPAQGLSHVSGVVSKEREVSEREGHRLLTGNGNNIISQSRGTPLHGMFWVDLRSREYYPRRVVTRPLDLSCASSILSPLASPTRPAPTEAPQSQRVSGVRVGRRPSPDAALQSAHHEREVQALELDQAVTVLAQLLRRVTCPRKRFGLVVFHT